MLGRMVFAAALTLAAVTSASAQGRGDARERAACRPDVMRFCRQVIKDTNGRRFQYPQLPAKPSGANQPSLQCGPGQPRTIGIDEHDQRRGAYGVREALPAGLFRCGQTPPLK
jgi:hypothetical protein